MKTVGIFDSGVGGVHFAKILRSTLPSVRVQVARDSKNGSYTSRTPREIRALVHAGIQPLLKTDIIVITCTISAAHALEYLRALYPQKVIIGYEVDLKNAQKNTQSGQIAVLAPQAILESPRYLKAKQAYGTYVKIYEPDVTTLARQIETNSVSWPALRRTISQLVRLDVDCIILGSAQYQFAAKAMRHPKVRSIIMPHQRAIERIIQYIE